MPYIVLAIYLALSLVLQIFLGNFPVFVMAFPLNLIVSLLWFSFMYRLWKKSSKSMFVRFMLSPEATFWSIFLFIDACIVIGLTGERSYTESWVFIAILFFLQTVLFFVILRGFREKTPTGARLGAIRWRFILNHAGLLLALGAGFWGAADSETLRVRAVEGQVVNEAIIPGVGHVGINHEIILEEFTLERYENGTPALYKADLVIDGKKVNILVNHPYRLSFGEDLYLTGFNPAHENGLECCIMQIIREPWKYWAFTGIIMMIAGALMLFIQGPRRISSDIND
jgi:hypothetical protein